LAQRLLNFAVTPVASARRIAMARTGPVLLLALAAQSLAFVGPSRLAAPTRLFADAPDAAEVADAPDAAEVAAAAVLGARASTSARLSIASSSAAQLARAKPVARNANGALPTKVSNLCEALTGYSTPEKAKEAFPALTRAPKKAPAPQGVWGGVNALSVAQLEQLLAAKRAAAARLSLAEQAFIDAQLEKQSQTLEETASGEAFFDNVADTEEAVEAIACTEQPTLVRQGAKGSAGGASADLPVPAPGIALPEGCDLNADFGAEPSGDGWGSDCDE